jgi:hypothetical protein
MYRETDMRALFGAAIVCVIATLCVFSVVEAQTLPSPIVTSITRDQNDRTAILVSGTANPDGTVLVQVISEAGEQLFNGEAPVNAGGAWTITIGDASFPAGDYKLRAIAYAADGRESAPKEMRGHKLHPQPVIGTRGMDIGWFDLFVVVIFLTLLGAAMFAYLHERSLRQRDVDRLKHDQNMHEICTTLCNQVSELSPITRTPQPDARTTMELQARIDKLQSALEGMRTQLSNEMRKFQ